MEFLINVDEKNWDLTLDKEESENLLARLAKPPNPKVIQFRKQALEAYQKLKERSKKSVVAIVQR